MEALYKKKGLKFSGFSKEIKRKELMYERETSRNQRLSILRDITEVIEESKENKRKIPVLSKKVSGIPSRAETLKKWKEEKLLKQQKEKQLKKPVFKVGGVPKVIAPTPPPPILEKTSNQSFGAKLKGSFLQTSNGKIAGNSNAKNKGFQSLKPTTSIPKTSHILKKEPSLQSITKKSVPSHSKSAQTIKQSAIKQTQKVLSANSTVSHIKKPGSQESTSSVITRPVSSFLRNNSHNSKESSASFNLKQKPLSFKPSFSKSAKFKESTAATISNVQKTKVTLEDISESISEDLVETQTPQPIFNCDISHIVPAPSLRKSFAPENFSFCLPPELSSFNMDGLSAIYTRKKTEKRTSTPLKEADQSLKSTPLKEAVDSLKSTPLKEAIQSLKFFPLHEVAQNLKSTPVKESTQSPKSTPSKEIDKSLKFTPLNEVALRLKSNPLKETVQSPKSSPLKEAVQSLAFTSLHEVAQSLKSTTLKESAQSLKSTTLKESAQSPKSTLLKETDKCLKSASFKETNEHPIQNFVDEIESINDVNDLFQEQETKLEDNNKLNTSIKLFIENESVLNNEQKQSENDSVEFDKFLAEHGDEPLDTFSIVPSNSLKNTKVSSLNLLDTRQSRKLSNEPPTNTKQNIKPNLESICESSENEHNLGARAKTSRKKATKDDGNFTPRRSARLAGRIRSGSFESLLNIGRPSIMESLDLDESPVASTSSRITYDFDNLHLEDTPKTPKIKRKPKISLLYTPPTRQSIRKSIKGDLMSFSPAS